MMWRGASCSHTTMTIATRANLYAANAGRPPHRNTRPATPFASQPPRCRTIHVNITSSAETKTNHAYAFGNLTSRGSGVVAFITFTSSFWSRTACPATRRQRMIAGECTG